MAVASDVSPDQGDANIMARDTYDSDDRDFGGRDDKDGSGGRGSGYDGGGGGDTVYLNVSKGGPVERDLGSGDDVVRVDANKDGQVRLTFTSAEVGNGNPNDSGTMANQDGGLAVRLQRENDKGNLVGPVSRFDDEGITFVSEQDGLTFDVRDLVAGTQRGDQFEVVRLGTKGGDDLRAVQQSRPYYINAGMGDDTVTGGDADDFLVGGAGNDTLRGGRGDDTLLGGGGNDTAIFDVSRDGADSVDLGAGDDVVLVDADAGGQVRLTFTSADVGNAAALDGNNAANEDGGLAVRLQLEDGGNPSGALSRFDDEGITFVSTRDGLTFDVRDLPSGTARGDQFEVVRLGTEQGDNLGAAQADRPYYINAGGGNDTVSGGNANDFLVGGAGDDTLIGGGGNDSLLGGGGEDTFVFNSPPDASYNSDTILDFTPADDTIQLSKAVFAGLPEGQLAAEAFALSTAHPMADDRIIYDRTSGVLSFDADGSGGKGSVAFATLANKPTDLSAADFFVTA